MNILFVCTGNTCRSPMAAAILQSKQNKSIGIRAVGIHTVDGLPISEHAQTLLGNLAPSYSETSKLIGSGDVEWASYILTMTVNHRNLLRQAFPQNRHKIHTLKGFIDDNEEGDVLDPYGGDLAVYHQTFNELEKLIGQLYEQLFGG